MNRPDFEFVGRLTRQDHTQLLAGGRVRAQRAQHELPAFFDF
jgi:hypothetical protein